MFLFIFNFQYFFNYFLFLFSFFIEIGQCTFISLFSTFGHCQSYAPLIYMIKMHQTVFLSPLWNFKLTFTTFMRICLAYKRHSRYFLKPYNNNLKVLTSALSVRKINNFSNDWKNTCKLKTLTAIDLLHFRKWFQSLSWLKFWCQNVTVTSFTNTFKHRTADDADNKLS